MHKSDIVIARSGASTISEIAFLGKAAIFIPLPHARNNHQFYNALALQNHNACHIIEEKDLQASTLAEHISMLYKDSNTRKKLEDNVKKFAISDSEKRFMKIIISSCL